MEQDSEKQMSGVPDSGASQQACQKCHSRQTHFFDDKQSWFCLECRHEWLPMRKAAPQKIFISYPHTPPEHASLMDEIYKRLKIRGHNPWIDTDIGTGTEWRESITKGILESDWVIACLSAHSVRDPGVCLNEIGMALNLKAGDETLRTVLLEEEKTTRPPMSLTHVQWLDLSAFDAHRPQNPDDPTQQAQWTNWLDTQVDKLIASIESRQSPHGDIQSLTRRLQPAAFIAEIALKTNAFSGRQWLFNKVETWRQQSRQQPILWIKGAAGIGKSAIAAQLAHRERSTVLGIHFCKWNDASTHDAANLIRTMAFQIASRHPDYRQMLINVLDSKFDGERLLNAGPKELYRELIANLITPGMAIDAGRDRHLIVIDGLDEARQSDGSNDILDLVADEFKKLPDWLGIVVTSRPEQDIVARLGNPSEIEALSQENRQDLHDFLRHHLQPHFGAEEDNALNAALEVATERSGGIMLYAVELVRAVREGDINPRCPDGFPRGLEGIYYANMKRVCPDIPAYRKGTGALLGLMAGCPVPTPENLALAMHGMKQEAFGDAIRPVTSLLIQKGTHANRAWSLFHRSFGEWLTNPTNRHDYLVADDGKRLIGEFLWQEYQKAQKLIAASRLYQGDLHRGSWRQRLARKLFGKLFLNMLGGHNVHLTASDYLDAIDDILPACLEATSHWQREEELVSIANWFSERGRYRSAIIPARRILEIREKQFGHDHAEVASSLDQLATQYHFQGSFENAEPLFQRAQTIREKTLGPEHPDVAASLNNLASLYQSQGRYIEAMSLYQRALPLLEMAFGPEHPNLATCLNNLVQLHRSMGGYEESIPIIQRALAIREHAFGPEHPDVASSLNEIALIHLEQGRYGDAEPLCQRALAIWEKALGPEHHQVAASINNLALIHYSQGRYADAEAHYRRALTIREKTLGPEHSEAAQSLNNLGLNYQAQGRDADAEPFFQRALIIQEKALGPNHPGVATILNNLGLTYQAQGRYADAEPAYQRALAILEKALGPDHPKLATILNNLATLYQHQGRYEESTPLYQRALIIQENALGPDHPNVAASLNNIASFHQKQGCYKDAAPLFQRALEISRKMNGDDHPDTLRIQNNISMNHPTASIDDTAVGSAPLDRSPLPPVNELPKQPSRNAPCPCGSGQRFKHCHGASVS